MQVRSVDCIVAAILADIFIERNNKFFIPCIAEATAQRSFKKTVCPYSFGTAEHFGCLADFPPVKVHGRERIILFEPHGVQMT